MSDSLRFGLSLNTQAPPDGRRLADHYEALLDQVQLAEELGFDYVAVPEHHQSADGYLPQPLTLLAALAARTKQITLLTSILQLPLHHPLAVAEQAAIVDQLSRGRLVLGIGTGWREVEFAGFGVDRRLAVRKLEESVAALREVWSGDGVSSGAATTFTFPSVDVHPKPVAGPVPIWLGAMAEKGVRRAARIADGWILDTFHTFESSARLSAIYRTLAAQTGRPATVVLSRGAWLCDSMEEAKSLWWPHFIAEARRYANLGLMDETRYEGEHIGAEDAKWSFEALCDDRFLLGNSQSLVKLLQRYRDEVRANVVLLRLQNPTGPPMDAVFENMHRFAAEIIPEFRN